MTFCVEADKSSSKTTTTTKPPPPPSSPTTAPYTHTPKTQQRKQQHKKYPIFKLIYGIEAVKTCGVHKLPVPLCSKEQQEVSCTDSKGSML